MRAGNCLYFLAGKIRLGLRLGVIDQKNRNGNWIKIGARQPLGLWNLCTYGMGFRKK